MAVFAMKIKPEATRGAGLQKSRQKSAPFIAFSNLKKYFIHIKLKTPFHRALHFLKCKER
ncbi:hypothetical protein D9754_04715 [Planomicrobium sp. Y74]|nr:hypothetical protein D9754_04715 [Planomicrobium sp. Y74]